MSKDNTQTSYRIELSERILKTAIVSFFQHGIRSVKMDDIANKLGISKRTLYEIYSNKEELLLECVRMQENEFDSHVKQYGNESGHSVMDIIIEFYKYQMEYVAKVSPLFYEELQRYHNVIDFYEKKRLSRNKSAKEFFMRGVKEGYFRSDVDFDIVMRVGQMSMEYAMRTEMYKEYGMKRVIHNILLLFLRGLCTKDGIERLDSFITKYE